VCRCSHIIFSSRLVLLSNQQVHVCLIESSSGVWLAIYIIYSCALLPKRIVKHGRICDDVGTLFLSMSWLCKCAMFKLPVVASVVRVSWVGLIESSAHLQHCTFKDACLVCHILYSGLHNVACFSYGFVCHINCLSCCFIW
jgi:hypothetical protein